MNNKPNKPNSAATTPVLILAAGPPRPQVLTVAAGVQSAAMVPVAGRPVLGWILSWLWEQGFRLIYPLVANDDSQIRTYCDWIDTPNDGKLAPLRVPANGVGGSLYQGLRELPAHRAPNVLVVLGHTLYRQWVVRAEGHIQAPDLDADWMLCSPVDSEVRRWCYTSLGNNPQLVNQPENDVRVNGMQALIGIYHLSNRELFERSLLDAAQHDLTTALMEYSQAMPLQAISVEPGTWLDCGSLSGLQRTRQQLITASARAYHGMELDQKVGELTKTAKTRSAILQQYLWYAGLPQELVALTPRVLGFTHARQDKQPSPHESSIRMEYYGYSTLEEAWLYQNLALDVWHKILDHLFEMLGRFRNYHGDLNAFDYHTIYEVKTKDRLERLKDLSNPTENVTWRDLLSAEYLAFTLDGHSRSPLRGWSLLEKEVWAECEKLYDEKSCIIHGDFHLGNILYDPHSRLLKLLDPRGSFGSSTLYGDRKYDFAKLRHSLRSGYNYIVNDLFKAKVTRDDTGFALVLNRPRPTEHEKVADLLDRRIEQEMSQAGLRQVKLIEGLIFMSMIPLHKGNAARQIAMLATGLERLNEVLPSFVR